MLRLKAFSNVDTVTIFCSFAVLFSVILSTTFQPAMSQGLGQPIRVETKEQVINKRKFGWEKPLTVKDPNLSHWHWEPIADSSKIVHTKAIYGKSAARPLALKAPLPFVPTPGYNDSVSAKLRMNPNADASGKILKQSPSAPAVYSYDSTFHTAPSLATPSRTRTSVAGKVVRSRLEF